MRDNEIGDEGAKDLAEALEKNNTLTRLDVASNSIGAEGAKALAKALEKNTTLIELNLENFDDATTHSIWKSIQRNRVLYVTNVLQKIKYASDPDKLSPVSQSLNSGLGILRLIGHQNQTFIEFQSREKTISDAIAFTNILLQLHKIGVYNLRQFKPFVNEFSQAFLSPNINAYESENPLFCYCNQLGTIKSSKDYLEIAKKAADQLTAIPQDNSMYNYAQEALHNLAQDLSAIHFSENESEAKNTCDRIIAMIDQSNPSSSVVHSPIVVGLGNSFADNSNNSSSSSTSVSQISVNLRKSCSPD